MPRLTSEHHFPAVGMVQVGGTHAFIATTIGCSHVCVTNFNETLQAYRADIKQAFEESLPASDVISNERLRS